MWRQSRNQVGGFPWRPGLCILPEVKAEECKVCPSQTPVYPAHVQGPPIMFRYLNPHQALPQILSPSSRPRLPFVHCLLFRVTSDIRMVVATGSCSQNYNNSLADGERDLMGPRIRYVFLGQLCPDNLVLYM